MDYLISENPLNVNSWRYGGFFIETREFIMAGNVHGSFCEFKGKSYLSYHRPAPGYDRFTRMMSLEELQFDENGIAKIAEPTSSGIRTAFRTNEKIYAAGACEFSGGRQDDRLIRADCGGAYPGGCLPGYAFVRLAGGRYAAYKYILLDDDVSQITFCYRSRSASKIILEGIKQTEKGEENRSIVSTLPGSEGLWTAVSRPLWSRVRGKMEMRFSLNESAEVDLAWFMFEQ
jgi:hypothetical protein